MLNWIIHFIGISTVCFSCKILNLLIFTFELETKLDTKKCKLHDASSIQGDDTGPLVVRAVLFK